MRIAAITLAVLIALAATPASAASGDRMKACAAAWRALSDDQRAATTYAAWSAQCLKTPVEQGIPDGATGVCTDGSYTFATHRGNVCFRHGGLARWLPHA